MDNLIEVNDLHFSYGPNKVLKGINLAIPKGKVVGIMGSSGCGKSTLLRHFGGQLRPSRGSVKFMGQVVHELGIEELYKIRLNIGMMFQVSGLFTDLSVFDNLAFPLRENTSLT
jgi:phospholipid/cholesterol/gamma-HCH transport system ATP-binding protein